MGYTGYRVTQYIDDNPLSPTYGNTWTERELDTNHCPTGDNQWALVATSCEATTTGFTGNMIYTYYNSATNQYSSTTASSTECNADSMNEIWVNSGDTFCEQDEDGIYSGWAIQVQVQRNSNLLNYNETREVRIPDATCAEHLEPNWTTLYSHCTIVADHVTGQLSYDGTKEELQIDDNPSSPTFNQTRVIYTPDEENCPAIICDEVQRTWEFVDDICGSMMPIEYGLTGLTPDTLYHVYREYESCIVGGVPVKTEPTNRFSATTYQTSVTDCVERWVDTPQTVCIEEAFNGKWLASYNGGTTSSAECGSSSAITNGEVTKTDLVSVEIGSCVTSIGSSAFTSATTLSSVTIPNSVTSIGQYAFYRCSGLTNVTIPESVTSIGTYAFNSCNSLTSVTIPDSVTSLGTSAFRYCSGLTGVTIGSGITSIGNYTFGNCRSLTSVTIPNSVTRIGQNAFSDCSGLTSVQIGSGVTIIGISAFNGCTSLTSVNIPSGVTNINASAFQNCSGLTSVTIPDSVTYIGSYAFQRCTSLTSITIPSAVTSIGAAVFYNCNGLTSITVEAITPPTLGDTAFPSNCSIYVPCSSVDTYKTASEWSNYASRIEGIPPCIPPFEGKWKATYTGGTTSSAQCDSSSAITSGEITKADLISVEIGDCVTSIGYKAFNSCTSLTSLTIGNSVTSIGNGAFHYCIGLTSVTIPNSVTSIGELAFGVCSGLTTITIPDGVISIGEGAFDACHGLQSVYISSSVTSIQVSSFWNCRNLTNINVDPNNTIYDSRNNCNAINKTSTNTLLTGCKATIIPNTITTIGDSAFSGCRTLTGITIPNNVTKIGSSAFTYCTSLTSITIPDSVTRIGNYAFQYCRNLTSVTISNNITSISMGTFQLCSGLTSVVIPDRVTSINEFAFTKCYSLSSVIIPDSVINIYQDAFSKCSGLTSVTIGSGITSIGLYAFEDCTSLQSITCLATTPPTLVSYNAFSNTNNCNIFVPSASVNAYKTASGWSTYASRIQAIL